MLSSKKVLVLNRSWQPVGVLRLEKAMAKLFSEHKDGEPKATIVDCANDFRTMTWKDWSLLRPSDGEESMRSVSRAYRIPSVIKLTRYDKIPNYRAHYCRRTIYKRDNSTCQYCGCRPGSEELSIDHVVPRSKGGLTTFDNCVLACVDCNTRKADRTPEQAGMKLLRQPKRPRYTPVRCDYPVKDWETWLGASYWLVELDNDEG